MTDGFIKQKQFGAGRRPQLKSESKKRYKDKRSLLCAVKLMSPAEVVYLQGLKRRSGLTWVEIIYRGLGLRRRARPKSLDDLLVYYRRENE